MERNFENDQWLYADSLKFEYENFEPKVSKGFKLSLDVLESYTYRNLYIQLSATSPDGKKQIKLNEFIFSSPDGEWFAPKSTFGKKHSLVVDFAKDVKLPQKGKYKFMLTQYMRHDTLKGISRLKFEVID